MNRNRLKTEIERREDVENLKDGFYAALLVLALAGLFIYITHGC